MLERRDQYPGVQFLRTYERRYPFGPLAANVLGHTGRISEPELNDPNFAGLPNDAVVGQAGVEYTYDQFLRGQAGVLSQSFDAAGPRGRPALHGDAADRRLDPAADGRRQPAAGRRSTRSWTASTWPTPTARRRPPRAPWWRWTRRPARSWRWPRTRPTTRRCGSRAASPEVAAEPKSRSSAVRPRHPGPVPARLDLQAVHRRLGLRGRADRPRHDLLCSGTYTSPIDQQQDRVRELGHRVDQRRDRPAQGARDLVRHASSTGSASVLRALPRASEQFPVQLRKFGFGTAPPIDIAGAATGRRARPAVEGAHLHRPDRAALVSRATTSTCRSARATCSSRRCSWPRPTARVATDGTLPTPHVVADGDRPDRPTPERTSTRGRSATWHLSSTFLDEIAAGSSGPPTRRTAPRPRCSARSCRRWPARPAPPRSPKDSATPGGPAGRRTTTPRSWSCLIDNGGHGGVSAAPAAREVLQAYFHPNHARDHGAGAPTSRTDAPLPPTPRPPDAGDRAGDLGVRPLDHRERHPPRRARAADLLLRPRGGLRDRGRRSACCCWRRSRRGSCARVRWWLYGCRAVRRRGAGRGRGRCRAASAGSTSGSFQFQPSEFGKLLLILGLAGDAGARAAGSVSPAG